MEQVILQPAANVDAQQHYRDTVEHPVPFTRLNQFLRPEDMTLLEALYPQPEALVWGVVPGKGDTNIRKWNRVSRGDVVLFCRNNMIESTATVTHKLHNRALARELWGSDPNGSTWEYIYFLDELRQQSIPYTRMNMAAGYDPGFKVQGFNVLDQERSARILSALELSSEAIYPDIPLEAFLKATTRLDGDSLDSERISLARTEQGFLRNALFGKNSHGRCCLCGEIYPVELLVAAHIKKRSQCSDKERRDWKNIVAPMCKLGCDELYERGFLSVRNGAVVVLKWPSKSPALTSTLQSLEGKTCSHWNEGTIPYFRWHLRMNNS